MCTRVISLQMLGVIGQLTRHPISHSDAGSRCWHSNGEMGHRRQKQERGRGTKADTHGCVFHNVKVEDKTIA